MKKLKKLSLAGIALAAFTLTSCAISGVDLPTNIPGVTSTQEIADPTETETVVPTTSNVTSTEQENHVHSVTKVEYAKPTSDAAGNIEYYKCACGKLYAYQDMTGELTIEQTVLSYSKIESYYDDDKKCLEYVTEIYKNYKGESFEEHTLSYDVNGNLTAQTSVYSLFNIDKNWEKVGKYVCTLLPNDEVTQYTEIYKNGKISETSIVDTSGKITKEEYNYDGEILHDIKITGIKDEKVYTKGSVTFGPDNTSIKIYDESYYGDDWNNHMVCTYQLKGEEILQGKIEEYRDGVLVKVETANYENETPISIDVCEYENGKLVKETYTNNKPTTGAYSKSENIYVDLKLKNSLTLVYDANDNLIEKYNCEITYGDNGKPVSQRVDTYDVESDKVTSSRIYDYSEDGNLLTDECITVIIEADGTKTYWKNNTIIYKEWEEDGLSARQDWVYRDETHVVMTTTYKDVDGNVAKIFYQEPQEENPELVAFTTETVFTPNGKTVTYINYQTEEGTKKVIEEVYDSNDVCLNVTLTTYQGDTVIAKQLNEYERTPEGIPKQEKYTYYDISTGEVSYIAITYHDENGIVTSNELIYFYENGKVTHEIDNKLAYDEWVEGDLAVRKDYIYTDDTHVTMTTTYKDVDGNIVKVFYQEPQAEHPELVAFTTETVFTPNGKTVTYTNYQPDEGTNQVVEEVYDSNDRLLYSTMNIYDGTALIFKQLTEAKLYESGKLQQETQKVYDVETDRIKAITIISYDEDGLTVIYREDVTISEDGKSSHIVNGKPAYDEWVEDDLNALLAYEYTDGKNVGYTIFYKNKAGEDVKKVHLDMNPDTYTTNSIVTEYYSDGVTYKKEQKSYIDTTDYYSVTVYYYADGRCFLSELYQYDENDKASSKQFHDFSFRADGTLAQKITTFYNVEFDEVDYKVIYDYNEDGTDIILATMVKTSGGYTDYSVNGVLQKREYVATDSTDNTKEYKVTEAYNYTTEGALDNIVILWNDKDNKCYKYIIKEVDKEDSSSLIRLVERIVTDDEQKTVIYDYVNHNHSTTIEKFDGNNLISASGEVIDDTTGNYIQTFTRTYDGTENANLVTSVDISYVNGVYGAKTVISNGEETYYVWSSDTNDWVMV